MTKGAERFRSWRLREEKSQREVGEMLGIVANTVTAYECGSQRPGLARAVEIAALTDGYVRPEHWTVQVAKAVAA